MNEEAKRYVGRDKYTFEDLVGIMRILRMPDGCPWDREQTHASIRQNLIEETYEAVEGIDNGDMKLLCEELGDVLMQVVFHAVMAKEEGAFDIDDVTTGVCAKLVLRHPHVFGDTVAENSSVVLDNWDKIKTVEKHYSTTGDKINAISRAMPSLMRAQKIGSKCRKAQFDFADAASASKKIYEETEELLEAKEKGSDREIEEEAGDLLLACVNTVRLCGADAERALYSACEKYISRYRKMEKLIAEDENTLENMTDDEKDVYWEKAKIC